MLEAVSDLGTGDRISYTTMSTNIEFMCVLFMFLELSKFVQHTNINFDSLVVAGVSSL